ncbi:MAG TPA: tetratricopeptide repeat protein [Phycisphaerales bacterium]|nr:tetratricopeptide repeat protein [Phycisphaerales bacterium]
MAHEPSHSHASQIVAVIVTGVMCFIAGVLSSDAVSLISSKFSAEKVKPQDTIAASKPATEPAPAKVEYELITTVTAASKDPVQARAESLVVEGVRLQQSGDQASAIRKYIAACELDPAMAAAYNNIGVAYLTVGDTGEGLASLKQAADIAPQNETVKKNLDALNAKMGEQGQ